MITKSNNNNNKIILCCFFWPNTNINIRHSIFNIGLFTKVLFAVFFVISARFEVSREVDLFADFACGMLHWWTSYSLFNLSTDSTHAVVLGLLALCGLTSQKTHRGGLGLGGSVHEEAHLCFPYLVQPSFKAIATFSLFQSGTGSGKLLEFYMWFGAFWRNLVAVICWPPDPVHL